MQGETIEEIDDDGVDCLPLNQDVVTAISRLKNHKAVVADGTPAELLKTVCKIWME